MPLHRNQGFGNQFPAQWKCCATGKLGSSGCIRVWPAVVEYRAAWWTDHKESVSGAFCYTLVAIYSHVGCQDLQDPESLELIAHGQVIHIYIGSSSDSQLWPRLCRQSEAGPGDELSSNLIFRHLSNTVSAHASCASRVLRCVHCGCQ